MGKNKNLQSNSSQNFILKGLNSIQIGLYIFSGAYLIKSAFQNFISDVSLMAMMSVEIIEFLCLIILILVALLAPLAIFFSSRRFARKSGFKVWNSISKRQVFVYFILATVIVILLSFLYTLGYISYMAPGFLISLGILLFLLNTKKKKSHFLLASISLLLAILVTLIPTYWYSSLMILACSFLVYGMIVRK